MTMGITCMRGSARPLLLMDRDTQHAFVYSHSWRVGDLVIWDHRCTMLRGRPYDPAQRRDLRRVTTQDVASALEAQPIAVLASGAREFPVRLCAAWRGAWPQPTPCKVSSRPTARYFFPLDIFARSTATIKMAAELHKRINSTCDEASCYECRCFLRAEEQDLQFFVRPGC